MSEEHSVIRWVSAFGMVQAAITPTKEVDINNPRAMAEQIVAAHKKLRAALAEYADIKNWNRDMLDDSSDRRDQWVGPGDNGYDLARKTLEASDETLGQEMIRGLTDYGEGRDPGRVTKIEIDPETVDGEIRYREGGKR